MAMSRFDENTSMMRERLAATLVELRKPEYEPQTRARGIATGALLGVAMWAALFVLGLAIWRWITH
jgi:hypothetical protein